MFVLFEFVKIAHIKMKGFLKRLSKVKIKKNSALKFNFKPRPAPPDHPHPHPHLHRALGVPAHLRIRSPESG